MEQKNELEKIREVDYTIEDPVFSEPFEVYKSHNAWWISEKAGRVKLEKLIQGFKQAMKVNQSLILAGITQEQWQYFNEIHPKFYLVKQRCTELATMFAKAILADTVKKDWKAAAWWLERREPEMFGRNNTNPQIPEGGSFVQEVLEAWVDKDGNLVRKRKSIDITNGENTNDTE